MGFVTITDVRVTGDLREATVFYTVLGDATEQADTAAALESAKGMLRTEVGRQTGDPAHAVAGVRRRRDPRDRASPRRPAAPGAAQPTSGSTSRPAPPRTPASPTRTVTSDDDRRTDVVSTTARSSPTRPEARPREPDRRRRTGTASSTPSPRRGRLLLLGHVSPDGDALGLGARGRAGARAAARRPAGRGVVRRRPLRRPGEPGVDAGRAPADAGRRRVRRPRCRR